MNKVNIICIYWEGDFRGRDFTPMDVDRLFQSVSKHCDRPFDFYVLTNNMDCDVPGTKLKLLYANDWPGWWAKMELHRPDLPPGRTLYMDLDSHAIRSLAPILDYSGDLVMFRTHSKHGHRHTDIGQEVSRYQAATMLFTPGKFVWMYDKFVRDWDYYITHYRSDQDIMGEWIPDQPVFPEEWMMKLSVLCKGTRYNTTPPDDVIIITGQPKSGLFRRTHTIKWFEQMARG